MKITNIRLHQDTYQRLKNLGEKDESYDSIVKRLLDYCGLEKK